MKSSIITAILTAVVLGALPSAIQAQSTAFSYQGILTNGETPAEGIHDFEFRLFDAGTDGTQVGTTITTDEVTVEAGLFTIVLDYGTVFDGSTRYLEIAVRPGASTGSYTELSPRQLITATPYAVRALEATTVPSGTITSAMLADRSITAEKISAPGEQLIPVSNGNGGISWMSVGDYLLSQNYNPPLPGIVENEATIEISGVFVDVVQIVNGPGIEIERVPSTYTESGLNAEYALVFDYDGPSKGALQTWFDDVQSGSGVPRSGSIIVEHTNGTESFRWNFFEYELTEIGNGSGGKMRYTLTHARNPDRVLDIQMDEVWLQGVDNILGEDTLVEIPGIISGVYPIVEDDPGNTTLTMTFDYSEAGDIWGWVEDIATGGTFQHSRKSLSVIFQRNDGFEIGRNNYFECFPIRYQHFTGFGQDTKAKAQLVLNYDRSENAAGGKGLYVPPVINYFPGLANMEVPFDATDNSAIMELSGVFANELNSPRSERPVMISGPGLEIERFPQFGGTGGPDDQSGTNREFPIIFEIGPPHLTALQEWKNNYDQSLPTDQQGHHKSASLIVVNGAGLEQFRWNLFELIPFSIEILPSKRGRVTLYHAGPPDHVLRIEYSGLPWGSNNQDIPILDSEVEISGVGTVFAEVSVDSRARTITLIYDHGEGGFMFDWVEDVAKNGTTTTGKRTMTIKSKASSNYFGCFPVSFQHISGFSQDIKGKQKVVISYDSSRLILF